MSRELVSPEVPRRCEVCGQPVARPYFYNFTTRQWWHRACKKGS